MSAPILVTKLFSPATRPELVPRPRLIERLNGCINCKLTLVSAPAGFGKTTLVAEWLQTISNDSKSHIAWLSLDEGDNDPARFLTYFIAALNQIDDLDKFGEGSLSMLQSPQPPPTETVLTPLINEIAAMPNRIVFVLDDYHLIETQPVHEALGFLLENMPPQMHLVIATREDPPLLLSRLRAQGQLTELRAADLRFTSSEAFEFLNQVMGINLSTKDITALETRTEGWIVGLQMAALSMQKIVDNTSFIQEFTGSNRFVLDFLLEEVLYRQTEHVRNFLLQTSILDRLCGSLCDAVTGQNDGNVMLESLERGNLFVIPLDNKRHWYRYHHLFADVLQTRLIKLQSNQVNSLHLEASKWYEKEHLPFDAIHHVFSAKDYGRAADLIELQWRPMTESYQSAIWLDWVKELPEELVSTRPVLSTGYGWALLDTGEMEAAESRLRDAERWLKSTTSVNEKSEALFGHMVVVDKEEFRSLPRTVANARAYLAQALGDIPGTIKYAQQALDLLAADDFFEHGLSALLLGFAYWASGNLEAARLAITDSVSNMQKAGNIPFSISFTSYLADIMIAQGYLQDAVRTYSQLLEMAIKQGKPVIQETAVLHLGLAEIFLDQGDIEAARNHLLRGEEFGEQPAFPPWYRHWYIAQARMKVTQGDLAGAVEMIEDAESIYYRHPIPDVRPLAAQKTRVWLMQDRLIEALGWARERGLSVDDDLTYLSEFEHVTLARVILARYKRDRTDESIHEVTGLLERLLKEADTGGRMRSVIEILVLQALTREAQRNISSALVPLERALKLAEPESFVCVFVEEGPPMARLLYEALSHEIAPDYIQRLLKAFPVEEPEKAGSPQPHGPDSELIEPLSERELEVLQLITEGISNQEISSRLYLSVNTIKSHTRNIYGKLGVNNRTQAAARARALGILLDN